MNWEGFWQVLSVLPIILGCIVLFVVTGLGIIIIALIVIVIQTFVGWIMDNFKRW